MNELKTLNVLFDRKIFRIPDYQRGYAWGETQLIDFWEDLTNLQDGHNHYTGMISLKPIAEKELEKYQDEKWLLKNGYKVYEVVDGQQRLTTVITLLSSLLDFYEENLPGETSINDESIAEIRKHFLYAVQPNTAINNVVAYKFGYDVDNPSYEFFKSRILNNDATQDVEESFYTRNLLNAKKFFNQKLQDIFADNGETRTVDILCDLFVKLTQQMCFNEYLISDDFDVFVTFETMNNRGKRLSNLELLKNRLIYLSTIFQHDKDDSSLKVLRKDINTAWQGVYQYLGKNQKQSLNDDDFLRAHWLVYFGYGSHKKHDYAGFLLQKYFIKQRVFAKIVEQNEDAENTQIDQSTLEEVEDEEDDDTTYLINKKLKAQDISNYVESLKDLVSVWYKISFPEESGWSPEIVRWIQRLNRIQSANFRPLTLAVMADCELNDDDKIKYLEAAERFIFFNFGLLDYKTSFRRSALLTLAHTLYCSKNKQGVLKKIFELLEEIDCLRAIDGEQMLDITKLSARIEQLFKRKSGYYDWQLRHYFLYEYEAWLMEGRQAPHKTLSDDFFSIGTKDNISIEHIFPQTPNKDDQGKGSWNKMFKGYNAEQRKILNGSLGNLLALSVERNKRFQNDCFADKCNGKVSSEFSKGYTGYKDGCLSEVLVAESKNEDGEPWWDAQSILKRGQDMLDFMAEHWGFSFYHDYDKVKMLYLEFVEEEPEDYESMPQLQEAVKRNNIVITSEMIAACYDLAKEIRRSKKTLEQAVSEMTTMGMNKSSATMYLTGLAQIFKGELYRRAISGSAEKYYIQHIGDDFGEEAADLARQAIAKNHQYQKRK